MKDCRESMLFINQIAKKEIAFAYNNEDVKVSEVHAINKKLATMPIVIITHQKYKVLILLFYSRLFDDGYSAGTIKILQKIIRPALQLACDDGTIMKNPADGCTKEYAGEKVCLEL